MNPSDSSLMSCLVCMVTPMKREFSMTLDVRQFLNEHAYARAVLDQALQSKDERLRQHAVYAESKVFGPRSGALQHSALDATADLERSSSATAQPPISPDAAKPAGSSDSRNSDDADIEKGRANMLARYRSGLR